jgi:hypothetical protein
MIPVRVTREYFSVSVYYAGWTCVLRAAVHRNTQQPTTTHGKHDLKIMDDKEATTLLYLPSLQISSLPLLTPLTSMC